MKIIEMDEGDEGSEGRRGILVIREDEKGCGEAGEHNVEVLVEAMAVRG